MCSWKFEVAEMKKNTSREGLEDKVEEISMKEEQKEPQKWEAGEKTIKGDHPESPSIK